jgi:EAL domain-containing protein (putative c-di-GMP-specific phosphodiesterase class I)/DNA-binding NarL/FixJ family response regulator
VTSVLIADDERNMREALSAVIQAAPGLELAAVACNSAEAIQKALELQPDVALLDVRMDGGGGPAAARGIRRASPGTRILALSAQATRGPVIEMIRAGAVGYLVKGGSIDEISEAVAVAARGEAVFSASAAHQLVEELVTQAERGAGSEDRLGRVARVQGALDRGEPAIVFQPIIQLSSGRTVGFEALSRFSAEPKRTPDIWFGEAHEVGLGAELEVAAVRNAVAASAGLGRNIFLAVNASPSTVISGQLSSLLEASSSRDIVLEMTEHAPVEDYDALQAMLAAIRGYGVRIAVDDAGAGFASLRHILQLVPDFIKLDISLTSGIDRDLAKRALARGLITFSTEIGTAIVGEGIESASELEALRGLGVEYGQGFFLGRPGPLP